MAESRHTCARSWTAWRRSWRRGCTCQRAAFFPWGVCSPGTSTGGCGATETRTASRGWARPRTRCWRAWGRGGMRPRARGCARRWRRSTAWCWTRCGRCTRSTAPLWPEMPVGCRVVCRSTWSCTRCRGARWCCWTRTGCASPTCPVAARRRMARLRSCGPLRPGGRVALMLKAAGQLWMRHPHPRRCCEWWGCRRAARLTLPWPRWPLGRLGA
mmetsp:Transcript_16759/g.63462  ORF Transcript_16759/g.63462 Transcript_16759/m.63462 type:complete len:214 (+) Transcript_16759:959-1600(+)